MLPLWAYAFSLAMGPLVSSVILDSIPGLLFGMVSPFALKLQQMTKQDAGIGSLAGSMSFWSTLGCIVGSVSSGFFFVPFLGLLPTLLAVSTLLTVIGLIGVHVYSKKAKRAGAIALFPLILTGALLASMPKEDNVFAADGLYERVRVFDDEFKGRPVRYLALDRSAASAMYLDEPSELVFPYSQFLHVHEVMDLDLKRSLVLGAGAFSVPAGLLESDDDVIVDAVDIEPLLYPISQEYFNVKPQERLVNHVADGRRFLHDTEHKYEFIFGDAYSSLYALPTHMTTKEFYELVHENLTEDGIFVSNFITRISHTEPSLLLALMDTFQEVFPRSYFFATESASSTKPQNTVFIGFKGDQDFDPCAISRQHFDHEFFSQLCNLTIRPDRFLGMKSAVFTDWHSPLEHYSTALFKYAEADDVSSLGDETAALTMQLERLGLQERNKVIEAELATHKSIDWVDGNNPPVAALKIQEVRMDAL